MSETEIVEISIDQLRESPFNPRKTFLDIEALAADIKTDGRVLQPLLVRDVSGQVGDDYEVVFGHRRLRAAQLAGLASVPCMVRAMGDEEARRAQIRENLQRNDVHPIEEAEGFAALMREHGVTAEQLVEQTGRSKSYVYGRLKLLQAVPKVREACLAGTIGADSALLVARLRTAKYQELALHAIDRLYRADLEDGGKASYRAIRELLAEKFTLELKGAIFDTESAELLPDAGTCTACPKRSGNAPEYADLLEIEQPVHYGSRKGSADICTDPNCFEAKKKAHLKLRAGELEAKGKTVIAGAKARTIVSAEGEIKNGYVKLADVREALKKAKGEKPATSFVQNPRNGKTVEVVKVDDLKAAGVKVAEPKASRSAGYSNANYERERAERDDKAKANTERNMALLQRVRTAIAGQALGLVELRAIARVLMQYCDDSASLMTVRSDARWDDLVESIDKMDGAELTQLCVDVVLVDGIEDNGWDQRKPAHLLAIAQHHGIAIGGDASPKAPRAKKARAAKPGPVDDDTASEDGADAALEAAQ